MERPAPANEGGDTCKADPLIQPAKRVPIRPPARAAKLALYKDLAQRQGAVGDPSRDFHA
ncbi:MAG: hypothetical protein CR217_05365 [Beijerinckiaceae bacterium]|nr:MAG: hypothetical protein CR217_05365 [Beijerinckiaceae bacterium]